MCISLVFIVQFYYKHDATNKEYNFLPWFLVLLNKDQISLQTVLSILALRKDKWHYITGLYRVPS
jgi:hypothetical protein